LRYLESNRGRWLRDGQLAGQETARLVRAIAERLVLGLPAAAKGDRVLAGWNCKFVAHMVRDADLAGDYQRPIFTQADCNRVHAISHMRSVSFYLMAPTSRPTSLKACAARSSWSGV